MAGSPNTVISNACERSQNLLRRSPILSERKSNPPSWLSGDPPALRPPSSLGVLILKRHHNQLKRATASHFPNPRKIVQGFFLQSDKIIHHK